MATPLKIDPVKLNELLGKGKTTKEIAKFFECSPGAVSQAKRRLGVAVVKASAEKKVGRRDASTKAAPIIIKNTDDAKRHLSALINRCNNELEWIQDSVEQTVDGDYRTWQETALKHVAEARKLISTLSDIEYKLHHVDVVEKALLIMFEEVGNESKECQKRIRDRLERSQILFFLDD